MQVCDQAGTVYRVFRTVTNEAQKRVALIKTIDGDDKQDLLALQGSRGSMFSGWHKLGVGDWNTVDEVLDHYQLKEC